ncbi:hypothetical protein FRACYDRAFT_254764 [Fragilariopsis cylindrus CCMP1102]|uniref:Uncharacterized protein n=1 Tax=Fragilariopsis cylindrus CCMP1102 TaxID=635003 RepID=A0A1E7ELB7_9STRA|nr:hypothetical protein FRACYDRAFT_254764 [Fragilariopsis cylindrus CCMP1102]|eukprot:OEU06353.1 hypothetical protein FRACYDRAFT_254764 [Fragilariopsis cylindrus CCMP1102]
MDGERDNGTFSCFRVTCSVLHNNVIVVVNAIAENEDAAVEVDENKAVEVDENNAAGNENNAGDVVVVVPLVVPFRNDEILSCRDSTVNFFIKNPDIENECHKYAETYSQHEGAQMQDIDEYGNDIVDSDGNFLFVFGYPEESLTALESICTSNNNNGYWIQTTITKLEFTCTVMEIEKNKVIVNNYGECLANTEECRNTNISILMQGMFADMGFACYEGDVPPDNFNDLVKEINFNYFDDLTTIFDDDTIDEIMEELRDGLPEDDKEEETKNENEATTTRPPATSSSNTIETPPVEEVESSPTLYAGAGDDESGLDNTNGGLLETLDSSRTSTNSSYTMTGIIIIISCIVIATVGFIFTHSHYSKINKRHTGGGGGKGGTRRGERGGGRHAKLSQQQIGYEMIGISSGENDLQFELSGTLT